MFRRQEGMTIVEIMISLTIITVMVGLVSGTIANYLRATAAARNTVEIVGQHEKIIRLIRHDVNQSSSNRLKKQWWVEDGGNTLRIRKLEGFSVDSSGKSELTWSSDIVYSLDEEGFVTRSKDGSVERLAGNVIEFRFTEIANGRVRLNLTNQSGNLENNSISILTNAVEMTPQN